MKAAILAYHSQNIAGNETASNDHVALAADLDALHAAGCRFISLASLANGVFEGAPLLADRPLICLTFDDGCVFDVRTLEFQGHGTQTGFLQIMENFVGLHGSKAQPGLHATSFVIASPRARRIIDRKSLFGKLHIGDDWWLEAESHPLLAIGNHGWDHNHPDLDEEHYARGGFKVVDTHERCNQQVVEAGEFIEQKTGCYPGFFAYPFGESSSYIRELYFPLHRHEHRCVSALGTEPGLLTENSDRWNLPRLVCGRDWSAPAELLATLAL
jgi:peptidoglycan/xylan/chitin deacetylase (PgdA/CDA1 family)